MDAKETVKEDLQDLIRHIPLLGFIVIKMDWSFDENVPTAGITKDFKLKINKEFMMGLEKKQRVAILKHEALHVAHRHFERLQDVQYPEVAEIAREISINQYIDDLPKGCITIDMFKLDKGLSLENYYKELVKTVKKNPMKISAKGDENPLKGDCEEMKKGVTTIGDSICKDAEAYSKSIGKDAGEYLEKVEIIPTNYKAKIKKFVGSQPSATKIKRTYSRRSKRFAHSPGVKKELELGDVIFGLDTSGSMDAKELGGSIDVAKKIRHLCNNLIMIQGDTQVTEIKKVQKNIKDLEIKGRGGTDLRPIVEKAKEFGYPKTPLVMFTDGEIWDYPSKKELKNSIWIFTNADCAKSFSQKRPGIDFAVVL